MALVPQLGSCHGHLAQTRQELASSCGLQGVSMVGKPGQPFPALEAKG